MAEGSHVGRPSSWIAVGVMLVGFVLGGLGLVVGPSWPLFWAGLALTAVGGVLGLAVGILHDVVVDLPRDITPGVESAVATAGGSGIGVAHGTDGAETEAGKAETAPAAGDGTARSDAENLASG